MTQSVPSRNRTRKRLWLALATAAVLLAVLVVPPLVSVSRYKSRITQLIAASLGRPVSLSSVELRLLPWPGFVLTDLTVEEDPGFGAEPVLHANTVRASIRLLSLWKGRLEIGRISVDEASLNLVRAPSGRWNLDPLFRTAAAKAGGAQDIAEIRKPVRLPNLEATNSRINIKNGAEKLPFSLVGADLSFWEEEPGDWRIRLRGQPARTDVSLDLADTGVVRLEASVRRAPELRSMPVHLDLEWREAQLGQLSRLVIGSDPGWRGNLTGELNLDGTPDAARIKTRLRATGVHRAEFAPPEPMDFDANCGFIYHFSGRSIENLICDSPFGDGHIRLAGDLPGEGGAPRFSVELDRIPVAAALDAIRTVRSGFGQGLEAKGEIGGKIAYAPVNTEQEKPPNTAKTTKARSRGNLSAKAQAVAGPLTGSFTLQGFQLAGDELRSPIQVPKFVLEPQAASPGQQPDPFQSIALTATAAIPAGEATPLTVATRLALTGYQVTVRGGASLARAKELAKATGMADGTGLDALSGGAVAVDLSAEGPWLAVQKVLFSGASFGSAEAASAALPVPTNQAPDRLSGIVTFHHANWKADFLANPVEIAQATLHLDDGEIRWDPVDFSYGPVKGSASLSLPGSCETAQPCLPRFEVQFGALDAAALQAAILGAHEPGTLLSELIARLSPSNSAPAWPELEGAVKADSLLLGPVTLRDLSATLRIVHSGADLATLDAGLLGGRVHGSGKIGAAGTDREKPTYALEGRFEKLSPPAVGDLLGLRWSGGTLGADGKVELSGFTDKDLTASAKGALHFEWRRGSVGVKEVTQAGSAAPLPATPPIPPALARFDRWSGDALIANGAIALKQNQVLQGGRERSVVAAVTLGNPPKISLAATAETRSRR